MLSVNSLLVSCLVAAVNCVYVPKTPGISQSLINLGKMDFSFYINTQDAPKPKKTSRSRQEEMPSPTSCPCNSMKNFARSPDFFQASDIFNKILSSNDMFHHTKEPMVSGLCCNSNEETFIIEPQRSMPMPNMLRQGLPSSMPLQFPFNIESLLPQSHLKSKPETTKTFEIVFFADPKMKMPTPKKDVSFVGKDNFKLFNLSSFFPINGVVKKDLNKATPKPEVVTAKSTVKPTTTMTTEKVTEKVIPEINNNNIAQNSTDTKVLDSMLL